MFFYLGQKNVPCTRYVFLEIAHLLFKVKMSAFGACAGKCSTGGATEVTLAAQRMAFKAPGQLGTEWLDS